MRRRKWFATAMTALLAVCMTVGMVPTAAFASVEEPVTSDWDVSKSKTASPTELEGDNKTTSVTLSLPSKEEELSSDVVFVLDESSCVDDVLTSLSSMLETLGESIDESDATLNVGVVVFRGNADVAYRLQAYKSGDNLTIAQAALNSPLLDSTTALKGSNMPSGILAAQQMLENSSTPTSRQHVILVSDGKTYVYTDGSDPASHLSRTSGLGHNDGSLYEWTSKYDPEASYSGTFPYPTGYEHGMDTLDWNTFMAATSTKLGAETVDYDQEYTRIAHGQANLTVPDPIFNADNVATFTTNVEKSMYQASSSWNELVASGVNCYAVNENSADDIGVFSSYMDYLGDLGKGSNMNFDNITKDIVYAIQSGTVTDKIGSDFDLVKDGTTSPFSMTVGGTELAETKTGTDEWSFGTADAGTYPYVVSYDEAAETITWTINVPVKNLSRVTLTYDLKLTASPTVVTSYDTNGDTTLDAVDSQGNEQTVSFTSPSVTYTPASEPTPEPVTPEPVTPTDNGTTSTVTPSGTPKTGDSGTPYAALIATSGIALVALCAVLKKRSAR